MAEHDTPREMECLERLGHLASEVLQEVRPDPRLDAAAEALLVTRVAQGVRRPRVTPRARRAAIVLVAAAAAAALVFLARPSRHLDFAVHGVSTTETGYVRAPATGASVSFSDGSRLELAEGAIARVADVTAAGARILVEDGRVHVRVAPGPGARWSVEAGPFAVLVTGTAFGIEWHAREQRLEITLDEGTVIVRGPMAEAGVPVSAGHKLVADVASSELRIAPLSSPRAAATATHSAAPIAPADDPAPVPPATPPPSWSQRVASGDHAGVLAEAERRGIATVLAQASLADLVAVGDAARYTGRIDVARQALVATRSRFAGTSHARTAAFLLGRIADDSGSTASAIQWYGDYLAEAPGGSFAAEALGRKMVALKRSGGAAAARPAAEEYLRRFPKGAHATLARQLL